MADAAEGRFEIGRVMGDAGRMVAGTWPVVAPVALLFAALPAALVGVIGYANRQDPQGVEAITRLGNIATSFLSLVVMIVAVHAGINYLNGKTVTINDALQKSSQTFLAVWGIGILTGLGMVIGLILFVIPGIFLALAWSAAVPIRVMEKIDATDAISRSFRLTATHRWAILRGSGFGWRLSRSIADLCGPCFCAGLGWPDRGHRRGGSPRFHRLHRRWTGGIRGVYLLRASPHQGRRRRNGR